MTQKLTQRAEAPAYEHQVVLVARSKVLCPVVEFWAVTHSAVMPLQEQ